MPVSDLIFCMLVGLQSQIQKRHGVISDTSLDFNQSLHHNYFGDNAGEWGHRAEAICRYQLATHPPKRPRGYVYHLMPIYTKNNDFDQYMIACSYPSDEVTATSGVTPHAIWEGDDGVMMMFQVLLNKYLEKNLLYDYSLEPMYEPETNCVGLRGLRKKRVFNQNVCMSFFSFHGEENNTYSEVARRGNLNVLATSFSEWADAKFADIYNVKCQSKPENTDTVDCIGILGLEPYMYSSFCCCSTAKPCNEVTYSGQLKCAFIDNSFISTSDTMQDTIYGSACSMSIVISENGITIVLKASSKSDCPPNGDFCMNSNPGCSILHEAALEPKTYTCCCQYEMCNLRMFKSFAQSRVNKPTESVIFGYNWGKRPCAFGDSITPYVIEGEVRCLLAYDPVRKKLITGDIIGRFGNDTLSDSFWEINPLNTAFPVEILIADPFDCKERVYTEKDVGNGALIYFQSCDPSAVAEDKQCDKERAKSVISDWNDEYNSNAKKYNCESFDETSFKYEHANEATNPSQLEQITLSWGCYISIERKSDYFVLEARPAEKMSECLNIESTEEHIQCCVLLTEANRNDRGDCTVKNMVLLYAKPLTVSIGFRRERNSNQARCLSSFWHSANIKYSECENTDGCVGIQPTNQNYDLYEDCVSDLEDLVIDYPFRNYTMGGMLCREHFHHPECIYTYTFTESAQIGAVVCCCQESECSPWENVDTAAKEGKKIGDFADVVYSKYFSNLNG